ncbi:MAG: hypothetical protein QW701_03035 [Candidatus Nezhaarchaeales archaeon]
MSVKEAEELVQEEEEDIQTKVFKLEGKVASLEQALNNMVNDANQVLTDVRTVLSELENPMNYLKGLGIDEVMLSMAEQITEAKLGDFMDRKVSALIKTVVEGKVKELVTSKVKEILDEELKKTLGEAAQDVKQLVELLNSQDFIKALQDKVPQLLNVEKMKEEIVGELMKELDEKLNALRNSLNKVDPHAQKASDEGLQDGLENRGFNLSVNVKKGARSFSLPQLLGSYCLINLLGKERLIKALGNLIDLGLVDKELVSMILRLSHDHNGGSASSLFDDVESCLLSFVVLKHLRDSSDVLELYSLYTLTKKCLFLLDLTSKLKSRMQKEG